MVNSHLGSSKVISVGQQSVGLNVVDFDILVAVIGDVSQLVVGYWRLAFLVGLFDQLEMLVVFVGF